MTHPHLAHFALTEPPFSKEIPDDDLWVPSSKLTIVESLLDALAERASVVRGAESREPVRLAMQRDAVAELVAGDVGDSMTPSRTSPAATAAASARS